MTTPPDKLFRQGLEQYQKPAPGSAWERIESGLDRKKHKRPWFKIAATLLLLMVASFVIWQLNETDTAVATISKESSSGKLTTDTISSVATEDSKDKIRESSDVSREAVVIRESSGVSRETLNGNKTLVDNYAQVSVNNKNPPSSRLQSTVYSQQLAVPSPQSAVSSQQSAVSTQKTVTPDESHMAATIEPVEINVDPTPVTQAEITNEKSNADVASNSKRTSITYTAAEVNAKYLKKESTAEATPEKKNTSGLQKVIDLALDLKNEGSVLGDIREKKNEWLSFNGPSNKRETNK